MSEAAGSGVLGLVVASPGTGLSEELVEGREPAKLDSDSLPRCPPGPALEPAVAWEIASSIMVF